MDFWSNWLPNIVCTVGGCLLSFAIGWRAATSAERRGNRHSIMLETLLIGLETQGAVELARDQDGRITGGRNVTVALTGARAQFAAGNVTPANE